MRKVFSVLAVIVAVFVLAAPSAMAGDFFYNWLRDDDGDGIPNCIDGDYVPPEDGTGYGKLGPVEGLALTDGNDDGSDQIRIRTDKRAGELNGYSYLYRYRHMRLLGK